MSSVVAQLNANDSETGRRESWQRLLRYPVRELARLLAIETKKFMARKPYNDQVGLALFTLAVTQNNQDAWSCLYEQYKPLVVSWIARHPQAAQVMVHDGGDATSLVDSAFAKFFRAMSPTKLEHFDSLGALLRYLQSCVQSVIADGVRSMRASSNESTLDEIEYDLATDDPTDGILVAMQAEQIWQLIEEVLPSKEERWLLRQTFVGDLRPSEICEGAPSTFSSVDDVYRIKRNVLERLRHNQRLRRALAAVN